ncbi:MAG: hypothetical protein HY747_01470 [Elusimicrobia bacterium]|nr:hypothetical protein [Elusimicrobiota bacterium]
MRMDCSVSNEEIWDVRDSSGNTVPNGLYFVYLLATSPLYPGVTLYADVPEMVPVDILRFTKFATKGISKSGDVASVDYTITGDAAVRILIAEPGGKMTLDDAGNIQLLKAPGPGFELSTSTRVIQVLTFNRKYGPYSDTWNGTDQSGVLVSSGIYSVGISAKDAFGNKALNLTGDNGPLVGTIPIDRTASQLATDTTPQLLLSAASLDFGDVRRGDSSSKTFVISNSGGGTLSGTITADQSWLSVDPASFSTNTTTVTVTVNNPKLKDGSYTGKVTVNAGAGGKQDVSVKIAATCVITKPNPYSLSTGRPLIFWGSGVVAYDTEINIYTLAGDLVNTLKETNGSNEISWDGRNNWGNKIVPGIYLYMTVSPTEKNSGKFTVVR